jgi:hypothetical protein
MFIRITRPPLGEAPLWVREAWVGLELPLARPILRKWYSVGVLTGAKSRLGQIWGIITGRIEKTSGYPVIAKEAVDLLAAKNEAAVAWWRQNAVHLLNGRALFIFDVGACEVVTPPETPIPATEN